MWCSKPFYHYHSSLWFVSSNSCCTNMVVLNLKIYILGYQPWRQTVRGSGIEKLDVVRWVWGFRRWLSHRRHEIPGNSLQIPFYLTTTYIRSVHHTIWWRAFLKKKAKYVHCEQENMNTLNFWLIQVNMDSSYSMDKLQFLLSVIAPVLECYYVVACHVETLINNPMQGTRPF